MAAHGVIRRHLLTSIQGDRFDGCLAVVRQMTDKGGGA
jgi:hypothetical protein